MTGSGDTPDLALTRFRAVSEESLRRAGESLSGLLGHPVRLTVSAISTVPVGALPDLTAEAVSGPMAGLLIRFSGEAAGQIVILFPLATVFRMLGVLLNAVSPALLRRLASTQPGSWRWGLFADLHHAEWGARLVKATGASQDLVDLIRYHQHADGADLRLRALQEADGAN